MGLHKWVSKLLPVLLVSGGLAVAQELPDEEQTFYIPQVGHGGGLETEFNMINLSESDRRVEIRTFGADGSPANLLLMEASVSEPASATSATGEELAPLGVASILSFSSSPSEMATGWAEITTTGSVAPEVVFSARGPEGLLTSTSVPPMEASTAFSVMAFATQTLRTGLALLNPPSNAQPAAVTMELVGPLADMYSSVELSVPPGQTIPPQFVDELFPELQGQEFFGSLDIRSSQPVVAMAIRVEGIHFTTQLVHPAPTTAGSASAVATSTSADAAAASSGNQIKVDSSMTSTRRLNADTTGGVLTANLLFPADHDGSPFVVELHFSGPIVTKPRHVRGDDAFSVTGGSITNAKRPNRQRRSNGEWMASQWKLTVKPSGSGDVVLAAPGGRSCTENGSFCTEAGQSLSHPLSATIRGTGTGEQPRPQPQQSSNDGCADHYSGYQMSVQPICQREDTRSFSSTYRVVIAGSSPYLPEWYKLRYWGGCHSRSYSGYLLYPDSTPQRPLLIGRQGQRVWAGSGGSESAQVWFTEPDDPGYDGPAPPGDAQLTVTPTFGPSYKLGRVCTADEIEAQRPQ